VDPGAVPGASTISPRCYPGLWGRHRFDTRGKDASFARHCTAVIGLYYKCQW